MEILRLAMESEEARIRAEAERDEAIRTKALNAAPVEVDPA